MKPIVALQYILNVLLMNMFLVRQRASVCPAFAEQAVPRPHLLCGVWRGAPGHPRPLLATAQRLPRHALPSQQRTVQHNTTPDYE